MPFRNMGQKLFMDEGRLLVPFLAGSMTDEDFLSTRTSAAVSAGMYD